MTLNKQLPRTTVWMSLPSVQLVWRESVKQLSATPLNSFKRGEPWQRPCIEIQHAKKLSMSELKTNFHPSLKLGFRLVILSEGCLLDLESAQDFDSWEIAPIWYAMPRPQNSHPSMWWPHSIMLNRGFRERVLLLCATDSPLGNDVGWSSHNEQIFPT